MAGLKSLIGRRRRVGDEGEEDEGPIIVADSQSEGSVLSDADDDDAESLTGDDAGEQSKEGADVRAEEAGANGDRSKKMRKPRQKGKKMREPAATVTSDSAQPQPAFKAMADTEAMMNGLKIDESAKEQEAVDFETMGQNGHSAPQPSAPTILNGSTETPAQRQRREHEEYKRKRDTNPAFIPNRGNFFMHDTRGAQNGQGPQVQRGGFAGRGRGRGGAVVGGPFSPANQLAQQERAAEQPWKHDLHDTINEEPAQLGSKPTESPQQDIQDDSARIFQKPSQPQSQDQPRVQNFSSTTLLGTLKVHVRLPGMKQPILFSGVPSKHYVRLPNHRPPLRRDKPVRVSIPDRPPHYIFPRADRSFIFIPRQQRPSQQGFQRGGSYQRSIGGHGYSSRRTSMYGGSVYAPSVAASRRSSMAMSRADAFSPTSFNGPMLPNRPIVRMPPYAGQHFSGMTTPSGPQSGYHTPNGHNQVHTYPLPGNPVLQGTPTSTVHQPRPQKTISVTGIESPALIQQATMGDQQPFASQLPQHMQEQATYQQTQPYYSPRQQYAYPQAQQAGTPLSGIPEQAMNYQSQMPPYGQQHFYGQYPPQQQPSYYYSPPDPNGYAQLPPQQMYMPPQGYGQMMQPQQQQQPYQPPPQQLEQQGQQGEHGGDASEMVATEVNGMVLYKPRSEVQQQGQGSHQYHNAAGFVPSIAVPGLPPTPGPEQGQNYGYYPPMPPPMAMQPMQQGVWYPPGQQQ